MTSNASLHHDAVEKKTLADERQVMSDEDIRVGEVEDDGEIFKKNAGEAEFRTLGL